MDLKIYELFFLLEPTKNSFLSYLFTRHETSIQPPRKKPSLLPPQAKSLGCYTEKTPYASVANQYYYQYYLSPRSQNDNFVPAQSLRSKR